VFIIAASAVDTICSDRSIFRYINTMTYDKEIQKLKKKIASLETKAAREVERKKKATIRKVSAFLKKLGYPSLAALTADVGTPKVVSVTKVKKRATITDAIRKSVISALKAGTKAAVVAKSHGISIPSVNNIKKAAGLTKNKKTKKPALKAVAKRGSKSKKKIKKVSSKIAEPAVATASVSSPSPNQP
jgi:hypothetical protein